MKETTKTPRFVIESELSLDFTKYHQNMVREVFLNTELLLNKDIKELSEYDIQSMMFLAFRAAFVNSPFQADREKHGKVDCVVFEKSEPRVLYEVKTYFKDSEKLTLKNFQDDLKKLKSRKGEGKSEVRAFFLVAAKKNKISERSLESKPDLLDLVYPKNRTWRTFSLGDDQSVRLRPSRREEHGRSVVLTWEVK